MSVNKWTTGPWGMERTLGHIWIGPMRNDGIKVNLVVVGITRDPSYRESVRQQIDADARLIAAAPDLAEALERLIAAYASNYPTEMRAECWEQAGAALAKARGES